jgi:hypothetical protein
MPIALVLVFLELKVLSWLVVEEEVSDRPVFITQMYGMPPLVKKKPAPGAPGADEV